MRVCGGGCIGGALPQFQPRRVKSKLGIEPQIRTSAEPTKDEDGSEDTPVEKSAAANRIEEMKEKSPFVAEVIWASAEYQGDSIPEIIEETIEVEAVDEVDADIVFDKNATELEVESVIAPKE